MLSFFPVPVTQSNSALVCFPLVPLVLETGAAIAAERTSQISTMASLSVHGPCYHIFDSVLENVGAMHLVFFHSRSRCGGVRSNLVKSIAGRLAVV